MLLNQLTGLCGGVDFNAIPSLSECECAIAPLFSEVQGLLILPIGAKSPVDWSNMDDLEAVIDNSDTNNKRGKWLLGIGEVPAPRLVVAQLGKTAQKLARKVYELSFEVDITSSSIYTFLFKLNANYTGFNFWYYTVGGYLFGKQTGIRPAFVTVDFPKGGEDDAVEIGIVRITWYADGEPLRVPVPNLMSGDPAPDPNDLMSFVMYRQDFVNAASASLTWTQNDGAVPSDSSVRLWVFQDRSKLVDTEHYTVTPNTGVGESTITISSNVHYPGASYEIYTFEST